MNPVEHSKEVIVSISQQADEAILFFSTGKDSLVLLDLMYPYFTRIVCVFMYFVPGLDHIEKYLRWAKSKYPKIELIQVPHWNLTYILHSGLYCTDDNRVKLMKLSNVDRAIKLKTGINYSFFGMKKADSLNRRIMMKASGAVIGDKVYPLMDWTNKEVIAYMRHKKMPQPIRYSDAASGGVGFNLDCFLYLRSHYPQDLKKIINTFPLSEKILIDYENEEKRDKKREAN